MRVYHASAMLENGEFSRSFGKRIMVDVSTRSILAVICICLLYGPGGFSAPVRAQTALDPPPEASGRRVVLFDLFTLEELDLRARREVGGHVDPCAIEQKHRAVLFLEPARIEELRRLGVVLEDRGSLAAHLERFAPRKTMKKKPVRSLKTGPGLLQKGPPAPDPCAGIGVSLEPFDEYHSQAEGACFLRNLAEAHPEITELVSIGRSVEGRDIWALKITDHPGISEPQEEGILFVGLIHALRKPERRRRSPGNPTRPHLPGRGDRLPS